MVNKAIPALTSRFLLLMENNDDDLLELKPKQQQVRTVTTTTSRLEESKEPDEARMMFSSYSNNNGSSGGIDNHNCQNNSSPLWSYLPRFDTIPAHNDECGLLPNFPPCPLPPNTPGTPLSTTKGNAVSLFASFSSSPMTPQEKQSTSNMWQYNDESKAVCPNPPFLSPRTTDAVWRSPAGQHRSSIRGSSSNIHKSSALIPNLPPIAPPLLSNDIPSGSNHQHQHHAYDGPPSIIRCRTSSSSSISDGLYGGNCSSSGNSKNAMFEFDDDEVSLLADDPDEDDAGVFPPSTYDVLVNILDEIDKDESADGVAVEE